MAEEKDNWLEDLDGEENSDELEQSDIDALLSGDAPPDQADLTASELDGDELDQADIDSLLNGGESIDTPEAESKDEEITTSDLEQEDIDSLFANSEEDDATAESNANTDGEINQSDIDDLFAADSTPPEKDDMEISPDQEEIDSLFSEMAEGQEKTEDPFQAEEVDFQDIIADEEEDSFLSTGNAFGDEEFDFDDDLDIPDIPADEEATTLFESTDEPLPLEDIEDSPRLTKPAEPESPDTEEAKKFAMPAFAIPPAMQERRNQAIVTALLLLLLIGVFIFSGDDESTQIADIPQVPPATVTPEPMVPEPLPEAPANLPPTAIDAMVRMETKGPVTIVLSAQDSEGDELEYEVVSEPQHGTLKGKAPILVYIPSETFDGTDIFHFRVHDGQNFSTPAVATIAGTFAEETTPEPKVAEAPKEPGLIKPRKLVIAAKNFSYDIIGTEAFIIDWENIWDNANYLPYTSQVAVEIISKNIQGKLQPIGNKRHKYIAKKFAAGTDEIRYRFKLGKTMSKIRHISFNVDPGNPAPEIALQPLADSYKPAERVILDAAGSMDDDRESLRFSWEQISGVPVQIEILNNEESRISFIAPSSFNTVKNPGPLMRLTVTDTSGKKTAKDIKIPTKSRRTSALWGKVATGGFY